MKSIFIRIIILYSIVKCSDSVSVNWTSHNKFTYQASLRRINPENRNTKHFCSGAIISDRYILTAAHCVSKPNVIVPADLIIVTNADSGDFHETDRIIVHELYYEAQEPMKYDISLVKTKLPIEFGRQVNQISLGKDWVQGRVVGWISGWKKSQVENEDPEHLMYYSVETLENYECVERIPITDSNLLSQNTLCASHNSEIALSSTAGPLASLFDVRMGIHISNFRLIGIGSWSASNHNGKSDQFIRVSVFSSWIKDHSNITAL